MLDIDIEKMTPAQLDILSEHLIRKSLGDLNPVDMERVKAQLAGGDPIDTTFERTESAEAAGKANAQASGYKFPQ